MRNTVFYITVFLVALSSTANGQDLSGKLKRRKQLIYKKGAYHRINNDLDSALFYADKLVDFAKKHEGEKEVITAYYHKINKLKSTPTSKPLKFIISH